MSALADLPIDPVLPTLQRALTPDGAAVVLLAPPGAGKTTRVPLALLGAPWLAARRIVMLEPRRLAARAAAHRMAATVGEAVGGVVGYRIRHETRVGPSTRIEVVTEGVLTRLLRADPALETVGLVIFDEFHERTIHADLGLALTLETRAILRDDLRILVMSATLDGGPVAALLGQATIVTVEGRSFPVETRHVAPRAGARVEASVAAAVRAALEAHSGDILAFLPGAGEIHRAVRLLAGAPAEVLPLHGGLAQDRQDRALGPAGRRKVVLATSIAETSLTIDGVRVVIDGGWSRVPKYSPRSGMTRLATVRVTRAAADQRRGRAGRQAPGACYRLWPAADEPALLAHATPEILEADLAPLALDLAAAGISDPGELAWLDPPRPPALREARALLTHLGALGPDGRITEHGRQLNRFALHPRLAHMVVIGRSLGAGDEACEIAALLSERDLLRRQGGPADADLGLRLEILRGTMHHSDVNLDALRRARIECRSCQLSGRAHRTRADAGTAVSPGVLLALAYPDRIAQRRPGGHGRFLLRNGQGAMLDAQELGRASFLVAAELDGAPRDSRIYLAAPLTRGELDTHFADEREWEDVLVWDASARAVTARRMERLGAIILREADLPNPDPALVTALLLESIRREGVGRLPWAGAAGRMRDRLAFLHRLDPAWPDVSDGVLAAELEIWLGPSLVGLRGLEQVGRLDLGALLLGRLSWARRAVLDDWAPTHVEVPSGSRITVDYTDPGFPVLAVRLQELFGVTETPAIASGRIPLTLHILSPARRPVQVTRDLAGFWRTTYFQVRKDLKGRYPKHDWPDDPSTARPTTRVKRRARGT